MKPSLTSLALLLATSSCAPRPMAPAATAPRRAGASVWTADFMQTKPGQQARYLRYVAANWARARQTALEAGHIRSFRVLVAPPGDESPWDVILLTEFPDSATYANREASFQPILDAQGQTLVDGLSGRGPDNDLKRSIHSVTLRSPIGLP